MELVSLTPESANCKFPAPGKETPGGLNCPRGHIPSQRGAIPPPGRTVAQSPACPQAGEGEKQHIVPAWCPGQGVCEAARSCFDTLNPTEIRTIADTIQSNFILDAVSSAFAKYLITNIILLANAL